MKYIGIFFYSLNVCAFDLLNLLSVLVAKWLYVSLLKLPVQNRGMNWRISLQTMKISSAIIRRE